MGCSAHVFLATRDDDLAVAPSHRLGGQHHGFEARAADGVDGQARNALRKACFEHGLARCVLAHARRQHLTHDDFANQVSAELGALQHRTDNRSAQLSGGCFGQRTAKFTDGGAGC